MIAYMAFFTKNDKTNFGNNDNYLLSIENICHFITGFVKDEKYIIYYYQYIKHQTK